MCLNPIIYGYKDEILPDGSYIQRPSIMYPCGKCIICKEKKRKQWALRMLNESIFHFNSYFITLTYADEYLNIAPSGFATLSKNDYKNFIRRLRYKLGFVPRFFGCGEYGSESLRPHYHFILYFDIPISRNKLYEIICSVWHKGFVTVKTASYGRFYYIAKYVMKDSEVPVCCILPFQTQSQNPPIGWRFVEDNIHKFNDLSRNYIESSNYVKSSLPRSFEDKIKKYLNDNPYRKSILQKNASKRLRQYTDMYNSVNPTTLVDMLNNIERRYKEKKKQKLNSI